MVVSVDYDEDDGAMTKLDFFAAFVLLGKVAATGAQVLKTDLALRESYDYARRWLDVSIEENAK